MTAVRRLNHAVLYVRDARTSSAFYQQAFEFEVVSEFGNGAAVFMRCLLYTSPSPRDGLLSRMPSSA